MSRYKNHFIAPALVSLLLIIFVALALALCWDKDNTSALDSIPAKKPVLRQIPSPSGSFTGMLAPMPTINGESEPGLPSAQSSTMTQMQYTWKFGEREWTISTEVPSDLYQYYRQMPRLPIDKYYGHVTDPQDDSYLETLIRDIRTASVQNHFNEQQTIDFAVSFVQSLPYVKDIESTGLQEYPRYPIETIVDGGGDCEDTAILTAALLEQMGYDAVLLALHTHMAVGVLADPEMPGTYFPLGGRRYYYWETTEDGWKIGQLPSKYKGESVRIIDIPDAPTLIGKEYPV